MYTLRSETYFFFLFLFLLNFFPQSTSFSKRLFLLVWPKMLAVFFLIVIEFISARFTLARSNTSSLVFVSVQDIIIFSTIFLRTFFPYGSIFALCYWRNPTISNLAEGVSTHRISIFSFLWFYRLGLISFDVFFDIAMCFFNFSVEFWIRYYHV